MVEGRFKIGDYFIFDGKNHNWPGWFIVGRINKIDERRHYYDILKKNMPSNSSERIDRDAFMNNSDIYYDSMIVNENEAMVYLI